MPVVNLSGQPVDEAVSIKTAESFIRQFGFIASGSDTDGNITSAKHEQTGDILSFDCCYSNLELSFGKAVGLFEIKDRFERYCRFLNAEFAKHGYTLTGNCPGYIGYKITNKDNAIIEKDNIKCDHISVGEKVLKTLTIKGTPGETYYVQFYDRFTF